MSSKQWEDLRKTFYKRDLLNARQWIDRGDVLLECAKMLEAEVNELWTSWRRHLKSEKISITGGKYTGIYFMLVSYAVENFLKAFIVRAKKNELESMLNSADTPKFSEILKSHDLVKLARESRFPIKDQLQEDLLRRLARSAVWYGRYPVPTNFHRANKERFLNGREYDTSIFREIDVEQVNILIEQIRDERYQIFGY